MSLFRNSDYKQKKQTIYSKKFKLPTQAKTINHKCSQCTRKDAVRIALTEKEFRWLCPDCLRKHYNKEKKENTANFIKATKLHRGINHEV